MFSSTAVDPLQPIDPEIARDGNIYNLWTLTLSTGALEQYTDALSGNVSPVVLDTVDGQEVAFVSYNKGNYGIYTTEVEEPLYSVQTSDFGAPGLVMDFQAPLSHTLIRNNSRDKGRFEKMVLEGRPPINLGVTNSGDIYGGSALTLTDLLGEQQFNVYAASISEYRTMALSYVNLARRLQWGTQLFSQTQFFFGTPTGMSYGLFNRDQAIATTTMRGGTVFGIYPFSRFRRVELSAGIANYQEQFGSPQLQAASNQVQTDRFGTTIFRDGTFVPFNIAFIQETTVFREFGPVSGNTMRLGFEYAPKFGNTLSQQSIDADARYYFRLGETGLVALRARGFRGFGESPNFYFFGGNSELRGYDYLEFVGHKAFHLNAELRFPLVEAMLTPIGVLGGFRGVFFAGIGGAGLNSDSFTPWTSSSETFRPVIGLQYDNNLQLQPVYANPVQITGFRLRDARGSYGFGLETMAFGFPIHLDWTWRTLFNERWENLLFAANGGSAKFRESRFNFWIGYDF